MNLTAHKVRPRNRGLVRLTLVLAWLGTLSACNNNYIGFAGYVGNTPPVAPEAIYRVLGTLGTPFTLLISNSRSSWQVQGNIPLNVVIINNILVNGLTPSRLNATKLSNDNSLMSLQIANGFNVLAVSSTSAPYGTLSIQTGAPLQQIAPAANPDLRIFVFGPAGERFSGLIEDSQIGFAVSQRVPALFLFDSPNGKIDGNFTQFQSFGPFAINMTLAGKVIATAHGFPNVIIREP
ncbi:MAG TPA: hypothetical protein VNF29_07510 [Candidatus Binataceae bacterium]|nr:hypothetical protein [Candidatus Binataceae bacterium]